MAPGPPPHGQGRWGRGQPQVPVGAWARRPGALGPQQGGELGGAAAERGRSRRGRACAGRPGREGHVGAEEPGSSCRWHSSHLASIVPAARLLRIQLGSLAVGGAGQRTEGSERAQLHLAPTACVRAGGGRGGLVAGVALEAAAGQHGGEGLTWRAGGCPASSWRITRYWQTRPSAPSSTGCPQGRRAATRASWGRVQGMASGATAGRPCLCPGSGPDMAPYTSCPSPPPRDDSQVHPGARPCSSPDGEGHRAQGRVKGPSWPWPDARGSVLESVVSRSVGSMQASAGLWVQEGGWWQVGVGEAEPRTLCPSPHPPH